MNFLVIAADIFDSNHQRTDRLRQLARQNYKKIYCKTTLDSTTNSDKNEVHSYLLLKPGNKFPTDH